MTVSIVDAVMQRLAKTSGLGAVEQARANMDLVKDVIFAAVAELEETANTRIIVNCLPMVDKALQEIPGLDPKARIRASLGLVEEAAGTACLEFNHKEASVHEGEELNQVLKVANGCLHSHQQAAISAYTALREELNTAIRAAFDNDSVPIEAIVSNGVVQFKTIDLITNDCVDEDKLNVLVKDIAKVKALVREQCRTAMCMEPVDKLTERRRVTRLALLNGYWEQIKDLEHKLSLCNQVSSFDDETLAGITKEMLSIHKALE